MQPKSIAELTEQTEVLRIDFLNADLDLASTFCDTAELATGPEHHLRLGEKVREAINSIGYLNLRVRDVQKHAEIERRLAELKTRAAKLWGFEP